MTDIVKSHPRLKARFGGAAVRRPHPRPRFGDAAERRLFPPARRAAPPSSRVQHQSRQGAETRPPQLRHRVHYRRVQAGGARCTHRQPPHVLLVGQRNDASRGARGGRRGRGTVLLVPSCGAGDRALAAAYSLPRTSAAAAARRTSADTSTPAAARGAAAGGAAAEGRPQVVKRQPLAVEKRCAVAPPREGAATDRGPLGSSVPAVARRPCRGT